MRRLPARNRRGARAQRRGAQRGPISSRAAGTACAHHRGTAGDASRAAARRDQPSRRRAEFWRRTAWRHAGKSARRCSRRQAHDAREEPLARFPARSVAGKGHCARQVAGRGPRRLVGCGAARAAAWRGGALAFTVCAPVALGVLYTQQRAAAPSGLVDELVSSHVRAQISGRDIDVISSDQHTVKPWFNGRIDYAPPVVDLASSGFPLAGGRLDYVGHQRVAVLTYIYRKHVIDVYVFPDNDPAAGKPGPALSSDGYAVARWRDAGMMWWAVTDAAPEALTQLEAALRGRLQSGG